MDLEPNEAQKMLRKGAAEFLSREWSTETLDKMDEQEIDFWPGTYKRIADLGWAGLRIPERFGGFGGSWLDCIGIYEEFGKALLRSPCFDVAVASEAILEFGSEALKQDFLPKIARGDITFALNLAGTPVKAKLSGGRCLVEDGKAIVKGALSTDYLLVPAEVSGPHPVASLLLVPLKDAKLSSSGVRSFSGERVTEVRLAGVSQPESKAIPASKSGLTFDELTGRMQVLRCAEMIGGASAALNITVEYTKQRVQFGVPIGTFEVLQHRMADSWIAIHKARWLTNYWAWLLDRGDDAKAIGEVAKLSARDAYHHAAEDGVQDHGGYGVMRSFAISRYYRDAKVKELEMGAIWDQKERLAQLIGL